MREAYSVNQVVEDSASIAHQPAFAIPEQLVEKENGGGVSFT